MSIYRFKAGSIFPKRLQIFEKDSVVRAFQFGGGIPGTISPGRDAFAYDHNFTPQYYIPAPLPDFDLSLLQKQQKLSRPEIPTLQWESKDKGHSGTIGTVEKLINTKTTEYYDLIKENPEIYSNTREARQKFGEISSLVNNKELFNKIVNEKETNTKNWEEVKSKGLSGNTIIYDGQAVVLDENGRKTSISLGELQRLKDGDPQLYRQDARGNKIPRYTPLTYEALNNYHEYNSLTNAKGQLDPFQRNISEEMTGAWGDKEFKNYMNDFLSGVGSTESARKAFGSIIDGPNNTLFLTDVLKRNSSNQGQINTAIADLNNNMDGKARDAILRKLSDRNGVFTFRDPKNGQLITQKYNLSDPRQTAEAINDFLTVAAYSKLKNSNEVLVDTKEASDRTYKQMGKDIELKEGINYATFDPSRFYTIKSADGIKFDIAGNEYTLTENQSPIQIRKDKDGRPITSSMSLQNFPLKSGNEYMLPFLGTKGLPMALNEENTVIANAKIQVVNMPVVVDNTGQTHLILDNRPLSKAVSDLQKQRNDRLALAKETYINNPKAYQDATQRIEQGFNQRLSQIGITFQPMQAIDVITSVPENELESIREEKKEKKETLDHVINANPSYAQEQLYRNTVELPAGEQIIVTKVYSPYSQGRASILDLYLKNLGQPVYQVSQNLASEQNRKEEGGKIPESGSRIAKNEFKFTPITINDIQ